jgi:hypothetical protein
VYGQLFRTADPDGFGAVSGDVAVTFFDKTKLSSEALGQVRTAISRCAWVLNLDAPDLATCRHGESWAPHTIRVQCCATIDRTCASRKSAYSRTGLPT